MYLLKSYVVDFHRQINSSQSEERKVFLTTEKNEKSKQNRERCFFFNVRIMIRPIKSHRGVRVSRQNSRIS